LKYSAKRGKLLTVMLLAIEKSVAHLLMGTHNRGDIGFAYRRSVVEKI
jgi:hypothetical protein